MNSKLLLYSAIAVFILPFTALAGGAPGFQPLVGIPGLENTGDINAYINALYALSISVAALIAVVQIVIGGAQYMTDDLISSKSAAKERIRNAVIGLLIIISAVLVLSTLNEDLTNFQISTTVAKLDNGIPEIPPGKSESLDDIRTIVETCDTVGCTFTPCKDTLESVTNTAILGCALGGTTGAIGGVVAGSGIFSAITGAIGAAGGCVVGGVVTPMIDLATTPETCTLACNLSGGRYLPTGQYSGQCAIANEELAFRNTEITKMYQYCKDNPNTEGCCKASGGSLNTDNTCNVGEIVEQTDTGSLDQNRVNCESGSGGGLQWDHINNVCRGVVDPTITRILDPNETVVEFDETTTDAEFDSYCGVAFSDNANVYVYKRGSYNPPNQLPVCIVEN